MYGQQSVRVSEIKFHLYRRITSRYPIARCSLKGDVLSRERRRDLPSGGREQEKHSLVEE